MKDKADKRRERKWPQLLVHAEPTGCGYDGDKHNNEEAPTATEAFNCKPTAKTPRHGPPTPRSSQRQYPLSANQVAMAPLG